MKRIIVASRGEETDADRRRAAQRYDLMSTGWEYYGEDYYNRYQELVDNAKSEGYDYHVIEAEPDNSGLQIFEVWVKEVNNIFKDLP